MHIDIQWRIIMLIQKIELNSMRNLSCSQSPTKQCTPMISAVLCIIQHAFIANYAFHFQMSPILNTLENICCRAFPMKLTASALRKGLFNPVLASCVHILLAHLRLETFGLIWRLNAWCVPPKRAILCVALQKRQHRRAFGRMPAQIRHPLSFTFRVKCTMRTPMLVWFQITHQWTP